ncbi:response regulator [Endozoicomonas gorgoniicola]|uniref:Response regulator n=1 Tax=Endozoicomonas gorgoniicola TaxID=1234144 RepID=A0ABT3MYD6_9GAMM|nr:response regulator [Endozoicomonas gorgoniicola]MCW7554009.1 response regulator [Endozoicomonas gorgoniicola]
MNLAKQAIVYLLEKDTSITDTIRSLCDEKSMMLECFDSGPELLRAIDLQVPACIVAADNVPVGHALTLMEALDACHQDIPVIILGEHSDVSSAVAAIKAGAIDYIEKPVIYGRLAEHFNQALARTALTS